jgi:transposase
MITKRRKITVEFKTKVVLDAVKERQTLVELSTKHGVTGSQISTWKNEFIKNASLAFGSKNSMISEEQLEKERLFSKIGQLQLEVDFLKKTFV